MENNKDIAPIEIDLSINNHGTIDEVFLQAFGQGVKQIIQMMFGGPSAYIPTRVKGTSSELKAFAKTLARDKRYIKSASKFGLNDPRVMKDKYQLRKAIANFERATGIKYPIVK